MFWDNLWRSTADYLSVGCTSPIVFQEILRGLMSKIHQLDVLHQFCCRKSSEGLYLRCISWVGSSIIYQETLLDPSVGCIQQLCSRKPSEGLYPRSISLVFIVDYIPGNHLRVYACISTNWMHLPIMFQKSSEGLRPITLSWINFTDYVPGNPPRVHARSSISWTYRNSSEGFLRKICQLGLPYRLCSRKPSGYQNTLRQTIVGSALA